MASGVPLDDADRWPWLLAIAAWIGERETTGRDAVVTCSALKRSYRELLRTGHPSVFFAHLIAPPELIRARIEARRDHFMPPALLPSQLATLEPLSPAEPGTGIDTSGTPGDIAGRILTALPGSGHR